MSCPSSLWTPGEFGHAGIVDRIQALIGFRQELPQKIIHLSTPSKFV
ncbi:hypothetical protein SAMN05443247_01387 [Bradyrhizobium erythrophlei]|jgi:hypothetical protein|nr:hypothetical protein SAMN05443247_01387 [Bradyrhizobium erythrophlei]